MCFIKKNLKCQRQLDLINKKLSRFSGTTYRFTRWLNTSTAKCLYFSRVHWCFRLCLVVMEGVLWGWGRWTFKLQKRIVQKVFNRYLNCSVCSFKYAQILKFSGVYEILISLYYMYNNFKCDMYPSLKNSLQLTEIIPNALALTQAVLRPLWQFEHFEWNIHISFLTFSSLYHCASRQNTL